MPFHPRFSHWWWLPLAALLFHVGAEAAMGAPGPTSGAPAGAASSMGSTASGAPPSGGGSAPTGGGEIRRGAVGGNQGTPGGGTPAAQAQRNTTTGSAAPGAGAASGTADGQPNADSASNPPSAATGPAAPGEGNNAGGTAPSATALVQVTPAQRRTLQETVVAYGHLQPDPDRLIQVSLPRAGRVSQLWVRTGQRVKQGDRLLKLETAPASAADYTQAHTAVQFAQRNLARLQEMFKEHLATRDQVAKAKQDLADARAKLEALRLLGTDQAVQVLKAPFDGVVTQVAVAEGQRVQADTAAVTFARSDALIVTLGLEPEDAVRAGPGTAVTLTPVFPPTVNIQAHVAAVHGMINPKTRLVDTIVPLPEPPPPALVLDEYLRGTLTLRAEQTLVVPRSAVLRDNRGAYLFVVRSGKAQRIDVDTGLESGDWIAVRGALQPGNPVVNLGNYELSDGMPVRDPGP